METVKRTTIRWWPAWLAALRYCLLTNLTALSIWLEAVTPRWDTLTDIDWMKLVVSQAVTFLGTLGAIMNDRWSKARNTQQ